MYRTRTAAFLTLGFALLAAGCASTNSGNGSKMNGWTTFGQKMNAASDRTIPAEDVLANIEKYDGKAVRVSGKISEVCARKGCWIRLAGATDGETLFVKFTCPVDGRLVPMDAVGRDALVEGTLHVAEISEAEAKHYKEEAGASPSEIAKIVGPQKNISMKAPAAMIDLTSS